MSRFIIINLLLALFFFIGYLFAELPNYTVTETFQEEQDEEILPEELTNLPIEERINHQHSSINWIADILEKVVTYFYEIILTILVGIANLFF